MVEEHLLWSMLAHVLQEQQGFINMSPGLALTLQPPGYHSHYLLVILIVVGSLGDFCTGIFRNE